MLCQLQQVFRGDDESGDIFIEVFTQTRIFVQLNQLLDPIEVKELLLYGCHKTTSFLAHVWINRIE